MRKSRYDLIRASTTPHPIRYSPLAIRHLLRLLIPRQRRALPRTEKIELPKLLRQPHRIVADALFFIVVANLDEAGHREILAQGMPVETVVGQDPAQVGVAVEQ